MCRVCREIRSRQINRDRRRRNSRRGRPRRTTQQTTQNQTQNPTESQTEGPEQREPQQKSQQTFVKFMNLFARLGNVAIRTNFRDIPEIRENIQPTQLSQQFYMISKKPKEKYTFDNERLIDNASYTQITQSSSSNGIQLPLGKTKIKRHELNENNEFLVIINRILRQLDDVFIEEFLKILEFYLRNKEEIQLVEELFIFVQDEINFPYLSSWRKDKLKTYQIQLQIEKAELQKKYNELKQQQRITDGVPAQKLDNFVQQNIKQLEEEENSDPLNFFLQKLVQLFGEGLGDQQINQDLDNFFNIQQEMQRFIEEFLD